MILISIIIPVFNEEDNVIPLFHAINSVMIKVKEKYEIIFVDDGSKDNTLEYLKDLLNNGFNSNSLRIIQLQKNYGQTQALLAGFDNAKGDLIVTIDGDMQNDPKDIPNLLAAMSTDYDVICGWRKNRKDNLFKKIPSKLNNFLNRKLNHLNIHDSGCTLRVYRREAIENIQLFAEGHRYIPAILANQGFRVGEIVTEHHARMNGKSKYGLKRLFRGFIDLITLSVINKWGQKPSHLFSILTLITWFSSFLCALWIILEKFLFHRIWAYYAISIPIKSNPLLLITLILFLFGILLLIIGFITELLLRKNTNTHNLYQIKKEWSKRTISS